METEEETKYLLQQVLRSLNRVLEYIQMLPVIEPVEQDIKTLEDVRYTLEKKNYEQ